MRIAVVGGTGFIGSMVLRHLRAAGHDAVAVKAPRLRADTEVVANLVSEARRRGAELVPLLAAFDAVVNAAGVSDAVSNEIAPVLGANSLLPGALAVAADLAGCRRYLHVSSAAVQGRATCLDTSTTYAPTSLYGRSKVLGEQVLLELGLLSCVIHRPTSVHGAGRAVTKTLTRVARSPLSTVARPGTGNTPQVHVEQVAVAVRVLLEVEAPPRITLQPSEGFTTASFLQHLSGRKPLLVPKVVCTWAIRVAYLVARIDTNRLWGQARRLELLWFGQDQRAGWLDKQSPGLTRRHAAWLASRTPDA